MSTRSFRIFPFLAGGILVLAGLAITTAWLLRDAYSDRSADSDASRDGSSTASPTAPKPWDLSHSTAGRKQEAPATGSASFPAPAAPLPPAGGPNSPRRGVPAEIASGKVVAADNSEISPDGVQRRVTLHETNFKYPHLRMEEQVRRMANGGEVLVKRNVMVADHLMVTLKPRVTEPEFQAWLGQHQLTIRERIPNAPLYLVATKDPSLETYDAALLALAEAGSPIAYADPDYIVQNQAQAPAPNDPSFNQQWALSNTGQTGGMAGADINALTAWAVTEGSSNVIVAVIDTGMDMDHPDLEPNLWTNPGEIASNGLDDDNNGYVDDIHGYDFVSNDANPEDDHGHGSHTAGTVGAVGRNGTGVVGVSHHVKLMPLKFLNSAGSGADSDAIKAIYYATAKGVLLSSNSWGGGDYVQAMKDAINHAGTNGVGFVAASGNDGLDNDVIPNYPSNYEADNLIAVAATDANDQLAWFSNYGASKVHLAAPGDSILSTYRDGGYVHSSGTSMATPHVSGAAALLKAANPAISFAQIKAALLAKTDLVTNLTGKVSTGGRLDVGNAIDLATSAYPVLVKTTVVDGGVPGTTGNADGIISPGETAALTLEVQNLGGLSTGPLQATVTMNSADPKVTLGNTTQTFGVVPAAARQANTGTSLTITVAADHTTPASLPLSITFTDGAGVNRVEEATLQIFTVSQISGRITNVSDGSGLAGATVHLSGPVTRTATTITDGTYSAHVVDGSYAVHASAAGFVSSSSQTVEVPPSAENVNMTLGYSALQITPSILGATVEEDDTTAQTITLQNNGNVPLTWKLEETPRPDNAATAKVLANQLAGLKPVHPLAFLPTGSAVQAVEEGPGPGRLLPARPGLNALDNNTATYPYLPFADGFEDGTYNKWFESWTDAHREVVSNTAGEGTKSFRFNMAGTEDHFSGVHQEFQWAQQPGHVSFRVRTAARDLATAYMVLCDVSGNYLVDFIWFFAHPNGRFYLNADVGGNQLVAYDKDTWYHIEFRNIDWDTQTFDYYVNGTVVQAGVPFRNPGVTQCIAAFAYNYSSNVNAWFDGVEFSGDALDWMTLSQSSGTIAPGGSATVTVTYNASRLNTGTYEGLLTLTTNDPTSSDSTLPVTLQVTPTTNTVPVANSSTVPTSEDSLTAFTLSGSDADNDTLQYYVTQLPARGRLFQASDGFEPTVPITTAPTLVLSSNRQLIYLPETNENGTPYTTFTFTTRDKRSESAPATVTIQVSSVPDAPVLGADVFATMPGQSLASLNVLANDYSPENLPLTVQSFTQPSQGTVTANSDGTLAFQPGGGFLSGSTSFTYTVTDGARTSISTVIVHLGDLRGGSWTALGGNSHRSGLFPAVLNGPLQLRWTQALQGAPTMPVVADNRVYVTGHRADGSNEIKALHLDTGLPTWSRNEIISGGVNPPLHYSSNLYYVLTDPGNASSITGLEAATGNVILYGTFTPTVSELGKSLLGSHGLVHMPGGSGPKIYGVEPYNPPSAAYITTLPGAQTGTPTEGADLILTATGGAIHALDASYGVQRWTFRPNPALLTTNSTVVWEAGDAVVNLEGTLYCVATHQAPFTRWSSTSSKHLFTPAVRQGVVYATFEDGTPGVHVFDRRTGALLRTIPLPVTPTSQPLFTQDRVIVSTASTTHIISLMDGAEQQTLPRGGLLVPADNNLILVDTTNPGVTAYGSPPVITLSPATASSGSSIPWKIGTTVPEGLIHFTLDGSTPTSQSPTLANLGVFSSLRTTTVKAVGIHAGLTGPVTTATFTVGDSNSNQLPDWWEQQYGSLRATPVSVLDPTVDDDGDARNNLTEFLAGTNPNQSDAVVTPLQANTGGSITLSWPSEQGRFYSVQTSLDLKTWDPVSVATMQPGSGAVMSWQDTTAGDGPRKFYRVVITTP
ncbi:S8 family serine peptidase [Verrucomicrobium spinosum]|uniref:S8 family serine peptidase n=1 Tax=Verrucomicrobium spinosum TaxID=2736 RepID=UPI0001744ED7|nr:S8 family serine peptidase [Verrucomicrobium spinosum]